MNIFTVPRWRHNPAVERYLSSIWLVHCTAMQQQRNIWIPKVAILRQFDRLIFHAKSFQYEKLRNYFTLTALMMIQTRTVAISLLETNLHIGCGTSSSWIRAVRLRAPNMDDITMCDSNVLRVWDILLAMLSFSTSNMREINTLTSYKVTCNVLFFWRQIRNNTLDHRRTRRHCK